MAVCLLQKCEQNLQMAVNIYLENSSSSAESTGSSNSCMSMDVDDPPRISGAQIPVIETSSQCCNMEIETGASDCPGKSFIKDNA